MAERFAIWGAGAVGLGLAATLATRQEPVSILGRDPETRDAVRRSGLKRTGLFGDRSVPPTSLDWLDDPSRLVSAAPDWLLVCTKAFAMTEVAQQLASLEIGLSERTRIVLCQNGWGNEAPLLSFWPRESLFHARVITGFQRRGLAEVEITAHAAPIALGSLFGVEEDGLTRVAEAISGGGLPAVVTTDLAGILWAKMLYNCALNPLGALAGRSYGEIADHPTTRRVIESIVGEIFAVLDAASIPVEWSDADTYLATLFDQLIPPTAAHESSMLQDLRAGRPTEIEALNGAVERLGEAHGIETPVLSALATLVRQAEAKAGPEQA